MALTATAALLAACSTNSAGSRPSNGPGSAGQQSAPPLATISMSQGDTAPHGYYYSVRLTGFEAGTTVSLICRDTVTPQGFKTFEVTVAVDGAAAADRSCYSGDGPEHWVTGAGLTSDKIVWANQRPPSPAVSSSNATNPVVRLSKGAAATAGYWYVVRLRGFHPRAMVTVVCRDSADPNGFKTLSLTADNNGAAGVERACYSGDGPEHWVTANGLASNRVTWGGDQQVQESTAGALAGQVTLAKGAAAPHGFWYDIRLSHFPRSATITLVCRDSVDPNGFKTFDVRMDSSGSLHVERACYSGDGPAHWVTAGRASSNRVEW